MALAAILIIIIGGTITGVYWYKVIDAPREKYIKLGENSEDSVILDMRYGMMHHMQENSDGDFDGDLG